MELVHLCKLLLFAGVLSIFGAGLFLLVQVVLLLDFTHSWNDSWVEKDEQKWSVQVLLAAFPKITIPFLPHLLFGFWLTNFGQVCCSPCGINWLLPWNIHFFGTSVYLVQSLRPWLWPQCLLPSHDYDSCICICSNCFAPSGEDNFMLYVRQNLLLYWLSYILSCAPPVLHFMNPSCVIELKVCSTSLCTISK